MPSPCARPSEPACVGAVRSRHEPLPPVASTCHSMQQAADGSERRSSPRVGTTPAIVQPDGPAGSPLSCNTDLVSTRMLIQALKAANPELLVLAEGSVESTCTLTSLAQIGVGAYGCVDRCKLWLANDNYEQVVAVKRFHSSHLPNLQQLNHFLREASVLGTLNHRHIVRLVGIGTMDGSLQNLYTAQELLEGPNLMHLVERQLTVEKPLYRNRDALRWCLQIAEVLRYLHIEHDIVHRDVKLSNITLTSTKTSVADAKLLDWGLACKIACNIAANQDSNGGASQSQRAESVRRNATNMDLRKATARQPASRSCSSPLIQQPAAGRPGGSRHPLSLRTDVISRASAHAIFQTDPILNTGSAGTAIYMAPEARRSSLFDSPVDIYAFGIMAYELLNRTTSVCEASKAGHTASTAAIAMERGEWRPQFASCCPLEAQRLIEQCWAADPAKRPSADEIVTALEALQRQLEPPAPVRAPTCTAPAPQLQPSGSKPGHKSSAVVKALQRLLSARRK